MSNLEETPQLETALRSTDLRLLLCDELTRRCRNNPRYSLRAFARSLKLSHSLLSMIISGKRAFSKSAAKKVAAALELDPQRSQEALARVLKTGKKSVPESQQAFRDIDLDYFSVISDWYYYAILSLLELPDAKFERNWIAKRLSITPTEAKLAMERLQRLDLIEEKDGRWKQSCAPLRIHNQVSTEATRQFHRSLLQKALHALDNEPFEKRVYASITLAVNKKDVEAARKRIEEIKVQLSDEFEAKKNDSTDVYELLIQFFPLTKSNE